MAVRRLTTPRRAWLPDYLTDSDVSLACPNCGTAVLWTLGELRPLVARSVVCKVCGHLAQVPNVVEGMAQRLASGRRVQRRVIDPEAIIATPSPRR